jgi:hypothetical protein
VNRRMPLTAGVQILRILCNGPGEAREREGHGMLLLRHARRGRATLVSRGGTASAGWTRKDA